EIDLPIHVVARAADQHSPDARNGRVGGAQQGRVLEESHGGVQLDQKQVGDRGPVRRPPFIDGLNLIRRLARERDAVLGHPRFARSFAITSSAGTTSPDAAWSRPRASASWSRARSASSSESPSSMTARSTSVPSGASYGSSSFRRPPCTVAL